MRKYPIGLQDFAKIREGGYSYVDKTQMIYQLIETGSYYFLSRPRRFGKSLLLSTIKEIFNGNKELFKGLYIEDKYDWSKKHPVIHIRLSSINYQTLGLATALERELDRLGKDLGIALAEEDVKDKFRELIEKTALTIGKVVILIDEYDKPIVDYIDDVKTADENRAVFKRFYSVIKDADQYIKFLMITGVSKYARVSIFSDLNNLRDITLSPAFATVAGITQQELEANFAEEISDMQKSNPSISSEIKLWYNGYSWNGTDKVYNPFSILNFMADRVFRNYWFQTGTPTWLVKHMKDTREFELENIRIGENALSNFNIDHIQSVPILFQTGYLTIKKYDPRSNIYELDYPNKEVRDSLIDNLLSAYRDVYPGADTMAITDDLNDSLQQNNVPGLIEALNALISSIPYDHWKAEHESIFHIIIHLAFKRLGIDVRSEVHSATGRADVLVFTGNYIYAIEIKLDIPAEKALEQIIEKGYLQPYASDKQKKVAIGINFSSGKRAVVDYQVSIFS